jgi:hypothetical protein
MSTKNSTTSKPIFSARGNGKTVVGYVRQEIFYRKFTSQHVLRNPPALAIEVYCLDQLAALGVDRMVLTNKDTGESYRCTFEHFMEKSFEIDRGYGLQRALPLSGFMRSKVDGKLEVTPSAPVTPKKPEVMQMSLFEVGR